MLADNALTTLDRMRLMLGLPDDIDEQTKEVVELLINRASSWIERQIGRHLGKHKYLQWYPADGQQELVVDEYPIVSVEYIKEEGRLVDPCRYDYSQTADIGMIWRDDGWLKAGYRRGLAYDIMFLKRTTSCRRTPQRKTLRRSRLTSKDCCGTWWSKPIRTYRTALWASHRSPSRT